MLMRRKRRKKHPVKKVFIRLFFILLGLLFVTCVFFGVQGYRMYQEAIVEKSISERVEEIRSMDGFTSYSDLPQFYIDATISVEDHRFESHFGIDLIATGRAAFTDIKEMSFIQGGKYDYTAACEKYAFYTGEKFGTESGGGVCSIGSGSPIYQRRNF